MEYMRYSREVIVLEERDREFADRSGVEMKGYLRVETGNNRGAIRCVMQNVKYYPRSEYTYQLLLFGTWKERTIHTVVGTIPVSRYGTGEVYLRFHPHDVDGLGHDYGCYTTAIVAAVSSKNRKEALHPVLIGTTGHEAAAANFVGSLAADETSEDAEPKPEPMQRKTYNHYYAAYLKHVCDYFWNTGSQTRSDGPLDLPWLKIDDPTAMFLVSPGARYFTEQYGHFLLGKGTAEERSGETAAATENRIYYVAVPGRNCREEQPDGGDSGFLLWREGYWILGIDGINGDIFSLTNG